MNCEHKETIIELTPNSVHYAKEICKKCGIWIKWIHNPEQKERTKTSKYDQNQIIKYHNFNKPFCFFCLREKEQLANKQVITIDHIQELDKCGKDELQNLQLLCSACHKLKNWMRLYNNWHYLEKGCDKNDSRTTKEKTD